MSIGNCVMCMVGDAVSNVITPTPEQLRPAPEFKSAVAADHLRAIGAVGAVGALSAFSDCMPIVVDIEKFMSKAANGLAEQTLQQSAHTNLQRTRRHESL